MSRKAGTIPQIPITLWTACQHRLVGTNYLAGRNRNSPEREGAAQSIDQLFRAVYYVKDKGRRERGEGEGEGNHQLSRAPSMKRAQSGGLPNTTRQ